MLDQNTDRMWYVIGAVIVGAAIIFLANGTLPEIFASVTESFEEASDKATGVIEDIDVYGPETRKTYGANLINIHTATTSRWVSNTTGELLAQSGSDHTATDFMPVVGGRLYEFTGNNGLHNPSIVYYTADYIFITAKKPDGDNLYDVGFRAPEHARFARVSARDSAYAPNAKSSSRLDQWQFREVSEN